MRMLCDHPAKPISWTAWFCYFCVIEEYGTTDRKWSSWSPPRGFWGALTGPDWKCIVCSCVMSLGDAGQVADCGVRLSGFCHCWNWRYVVNAAIHTWHNSETTVCLRWSNPTVTHCWDTAQTGHVFMPTSSNVITHYTTLYKTQTVREPGHSSFVLHLYVCLFPMPDLIWPDPTSHIQVSMLSFLRRHWTVCGSYTGEPIRVKSFSLCDLAWARKQFIWICSVKSQLVTDRSTSVSKNTKRTSSPTQLGTSIETTVAS